MNVFAAQSIETQIELEEIADLKLQIITPQSSSPIIAMKQDQLFGGYNLTTQNLKIDWKTAMNLLSSVELDSFDNIPKNKDSMKNSLFNGNPFVVGFLVYESFESQKVANTGYVPLPKLGKEKLLGGHAVTRVGYDENKQVWIMRNSWGTGWGENGYFYMPYKYLTSDLASGAFWTITKMK